MIREWALLILLAVALCLGGIGPAMAESSFERLARILDIGARP